jgi:hypothetical protein
MLRFAQHDNSRDFHRFSHALAEREILHFGYGREDFSPAARNKNCDSLLTHPFFRSAYTKC